MTSSDHSANRVRTARQAAGLTQSELAAQAGVSRTAITAIEGERLVPSVRIALAVARVLKLDVVQLFGEQEAAPAAAWAWDPPTLPWRAHVAEIRGQLLMVPAEVTGGAGWPHDLLAGADVPDARQRDLAKRTLLIATCDPAASLLSTICWEQKGIRLLPVARSSGAALDLVAARKVHAAGLHLGGGSDRRGNAALAKERLDTDFRLVRTAEWTEGIAVGAGMAGTTVTQLKHRSVRWVGREPGSGARRCLDELLGPRRTYQYVAQDHRGVVELVASGVADAGVCVQLAGAERRLRFLSVRREHHDLCVPADLERDLRIHGLIEVLRGRYYRRVFGELPGYATDDAGEVT